MNRKNAVRLLAICLIVAGLTPAIVYAPPREVPVASLEGNAPLELSPEVYAVLAVPSDWRNDPTSVDLVRGLGEKPNLIELRRRADLEIYNASHADFEHRWEGALPEVSQGKPVFLVATDGKLLYKRSGVGADVVDREVAQLLRNWKDDCPQCRPFRPKPQPSPQPDDDLPEVAPLPDRAPTPTQPAVVEDQNFVALGLLLAGLAGVATFIGEFKSRIR